MVKTEDKVEAVMLNLNTIYRPGTGERAQMRMGGPPARARARAPPFDSLIRYHSTAFVITVSFLHS